MEPNTNPSELAEPLLPTSTVDPEEAPAEEEEPTDPVTADVETPVEEQPQAQEDPEEQQPADVEAPALNAATASAPNNDAITTHDDPTTTRRNYARTFSNFVRRTHHSTVYCVCGGVIVLMGLYAYFRTHGQVCVTPSGPIQIHSLPLHLFSKVTIAQEYAGNVYITPSETQTTKVTVETNSNLFHQLQTKVQDDTWTIALKRPACHRDNTKFNIYIESPNIDQIETSGSGQVHADWGEASSSDNNGFNYKTIILNGSGNASLQLDQVDVLRTQLASSGNLALSGNARVHKVSMENGSTGTVHGLALQTQRAEIYQGGMGDVRVSVNQTLNVQMVASGNVYYKGNPLVRKSGHGSGRVQHLQN